MPDLESTAGERDVGNHIEAQLFGPLRLRAHVQLEPSHEKVLHGNATA